MSLDGICINIKPLAKQITGIERYLYEIVVRLDPLLEERGKRLVLVSGKEDTIHLPRLSHAEHVKLPSTNKILWIVELRKYLKSQNLLFCSLSNGIPVNKRSVVCLHDYRSAVFPGYDSTMFRIRNKGAVWLARCLAEQIVTISHSSKEDLIKYGGIDENKICVIGCGWEHARELNGDAKIRAKWPLLETKPFFYTLGSLAPHKNLNWIIETAKLNPDVLFAVAGKLWEDGNLPELPKNVIYLGYVSDEESFALMRHCLAYVQPTKYEGFGIPPLEAMSIGTVILLSDIPVFKEIYGESAIYFDPEVPCGDINAVVSAGAILPNANSVLEKYTWARAAAEWTNLVVSKL